MFIGFIGARMAALSIPWDWKLPSRLTAAFARKEESSAEDFSAAPVDCEVRVYVCGDPAEALYVEMILEQEAIAFRREECAMGPYGFTFVPQLGFCTLIVGKEDAEQAASLISQALREQALHT